MRKAPSTALPNAVSSRMGAPIRRRHYALGAYFQTLGACPNNRAERCERQRAQVWLLRRKGFVDHALCGGVQPRISDRIEPMPQLGVQIIEIAERAGEEEVPADIPIRPLDLAF